MALYDPIPVLAPITAKVCEPDAKLHAIVFKDGPLTADEQAYLDAAEREQVAIERAETIRRAWASQVRAEMRAIASQPYRPHALEGVL